MWTCFLELNRFSYFKNQSSQIKDKMVSISSLNSGIIMFNCQSHLIVYISTIQARTCVMFKEARK